MKKLIAILMVLLMGGSAWALTTSTFTVATSAISYSKATITVTISDTTNISEILLYRGLGDATPTAIDSVAKDSLSHAFLQTRLRNGATYRYDIKVRDTTGNVATYISRTSGQTQTYVATKAYSPVITVITDSTTFTGFRIRIDTTTMACTTNAQPTRYVLQWGLTIAAIISHAGDTIASVSFPRDTIIADSCPNGVTIQCQLLTKFRDGAAGDTLVDTSAIFTVTTKNSYPLISKIYVSSDTFILGFDTLTGHTMQGFKRAFYYINTSSNNAVRCWVLAESLFAATGYTRPDSIWKDSLLGYANPKIFIGKYGLTWRYRMVYVCSLGVSNIITDTTSIDSVVIAGPAFMLLPSLSGADFKVYRGTWFIDSTGDAPHSDYIPIAGYKRLRVTMKLTGQRNATIAGSVTVDTIVVTLGRAGLTGDVIIDTLIPKTVLDTSALITKSYSISDTAQWYTDYAKIWSKVADSSVAAYSDSILNRRRIDWMLELTK